MTPQQIENLKLAAGVVVGGLLIYTFVGKGNKAGVYDPSVGGSSTPIVFNAKVVAENLYDAMKEMGTEEADILHALKPVTPQQFVEVSKAFGNRGYNTLTGNIYGLPWQDLPLLPLRTWLKEELSTSDYAILRNKYPNSL